MRTWFTAILYGTSRKVLGPSNQVPPWSITKECLQSYFYDSMYLLKKTRNCVTSLKQPEPCLSLQVTCLALSYIQRRHEPREHNRCFPQVCLHSSSSVPGEKGLSACSCIDPQCVLPGIASRLGILRKSRLLSSLQTDKYCWCGWPWCNS